MKTVYFAFLLLCVNSQVFSAEWGQVKSSAAGNTVDVVSSQKQINLIWPNKVVPGEELLLIKSTFPRYQTTFFRNYTFAGVVGGSLQINVTGGGQIKSLPSDRPGASMNQIIFVERASDGTFYFVPDDLKDEGVFKIEYDAKEPGTYLVKITKHSR